MAISQVVTNSIAPGAVVQSDIATGVAGTGPAFYANTTYSATIPNNATTPFTTYSTVVFDTASAFSTSTGKFQPTVAGYYQITAIADWGSNGVFAASSICAAIMKNGSTYVQAGFATSAASFSAASVTGVVYLNGSTDYVQAGGFQNSGNSTTSVRGYLSGALVRSA